MSERPIIFSGPMVRAILDGRKTQTRRMLKLPTKTYSGGPIYEHPKMGGWAVTTHGGGGSFRFGRNGEKIPEPERPGIWHQTTGVGVVAPYEVGDVLWVRETVACGACAPGKPSHWAPSFWRREQGTPANPNGLWYQADGLSPERPITDRGRWVPSIHMPRWASRITLKVTGVKVERLNDISPTDAEEEGVKCDMSPRTFVDHYRNLWERIHGPGSWEANPWIVAISFERIANPTGTDR